jgi:CRP-like cAMP-binding protein
MSAQATSLLDRVVTAATQNLRVEKLLFQLGLDPTHLTFADVFNRLVDITLAHINFANMMALMGAIFFVATLLVRTIVPLRIIGIISNLFFICYGALAGAVPTFLLYLLSLPINVLRLRQMLNLVRKARVSAQGDLSMDWLRPFMTPRKYRAGEVLFRKGDVAKEMFLTVTGKFLVTEIGIQIPPGRMMGELGFVDPKNRRTQTVESIEDGDVLTITYEKLLELYFQSPEFGYYFLRLTTERLMQNIARLEGANEESKKEISRLEEIIETTKAEAPQKVAST